MIRFSLLRNGVLPSFSPISANETPDIKERYPGTSGKTHGDKKEIKPAANAIQIETSGKLHILVQAAIDALIGNT